MKYANMTNEQINQRLNELSNILDGDCTAEGWDKAYKEYFELRAVQDERYRVENQAAFDAFYEKHIKGKSWDELDPDAWGFYSDWHKDMYGYRPRHT
jgi:hypothetical protein